MTLSYRKTREGNWAVFGPVSELKVGTVTVRKKDGTRKDETVVRISKAFIVDGQPHAFGYLAENGKARGGAVCGECGRGGALVQDLEDGMMKHYNCCDIPP